MKLVTVMAADASFNRTVHGLTVGTNQKGIMNAVNAVISKC